MSSKLKEKLEGELGNEKVQVEVVPVDSSGDKPKVYTIEINGESYFDWVVIGGALEVKKAPAESWKTPINFETHVKYFGPGLGQEGGAAKEEMYSTLKDAILAKA
ncbi:unnamed protein product [Polarella glacialis]|uniref:Uncharacterized protein n=1 Tax=Polarella glacialis TaxID=89957 RepID=A0A813IBC5_POLGL|nr:unnamed protein product [Polarella glacialis]|eukprot:CAMPEP_0115078244 /NCGR_PEP_ID=MMETSP0227-20121206/17449_1 /TAXON_ID=89957 /ORGANISM="Polarella glacialis, Strain CCMP 1383" /LENGTH=104 /DNA_ID=CAMNT_0002465623 /DNA_START=129 /DNA_END=443 /DNA_ORIENTATION=-